MNAQFITTEIFDATEYVPLTEADWNALSEKAGELRKQRDTYENAKKLAADMLKGVEAELDEVTGTIARKKIMKAIRCIWDLDFDRKEKRLYQVVESTGEKIYLRSAELSADDYQLKLDFEKRMNHGEIVVEEIHPEEPEQAVEDLPPTM